MEALEGLFGHGLGAVGDPFERGEIVPFVRLRHEQEVEEGG